MCTSEKRLISSSFIPSVLFLFQFFFLSLLWTYLTENISILWIWYFYIICGDLGREIKSNCGFFVCEENIFRRNFVNLIFFFARKWTFIWTLLGSRNWLLDACYLLSQNLGIAVILNVRINTLARFLGKLWFDFCNGFEQFSGSRCLFKL